MSSLNLGINSIFLIEPGLQLENFWLPKVLMSLMHIPEYNAKLAVIVVLHRHHSWIRLLVVSFLENMLCTFSIPQLVLEEKVISSSFLPMYLLDPPLLKVSSHFLPFHCSEHFYPAILSLLYHHHHHHSTLLL